MKTEGSKLRSLADACFEKVNDKYLLHTKRASDEFLLCLVHEYFGEELFDKSTYKSLATALGEGYHDEEIRRLLKCAASRNLVKIEYMKLEDKVASKLREYFRLEDVEICPSGRHSEDVIGNLGGAACRMFDRLVADNPHATVAIGGGQSLAAMVKNLEDRDRAITVVPLTLFSRGAKRGHGELRDAPFVAMALTWKARCFGQICAIPSLPQGSGNPTSFTERIFSMCPALNEVTKTASKADIVFCAASSLAHDSYFMELYSSVGSNNEQLVLDKLKSYGCVGHLNFAAIGKTGDDLSLVALPAKRPQSSDSLRHPFLASMGLSYFKKMVQDRRKVVLVAGDIEKLAVVKAVLAAEAANMLVTDLETAKALLKSVE